MRRHVVMDLGLTHNELLIMKAIWKAPRPISSSEIIEICHPLMGDYRPRSIYWMLNHLLDKKMICIAGYILNGKRTVRVFEPLISPENFAAQFISDVVPVSCYPKLIRLLEKEVGKKEKQG